MPSNTEPISPFISDCLGILGNEGLKTCKEFVGFRSLLASDVKEWCRARIFCPPPFPDFGKVAKHWDLPLSFRCGCQLTVTGVELGVIGTPLPG